MIKQTFIRHFATVLLGCLLCAQTYAQHTTEFLFSETAPESVRKTMQTNAKAVFAEINHAYDQNKSGLSLSLSNITDEASKRIQTLWATSHFYCTETSITTRVLKASNGYQVRNIPVFFVKGNTPEDQYQDIVVEFTAGGKISNVCIALALHQYAKIMDNSNEVSDTRHRQMIVEYLENFRTAYIRKDMPFLNDVYSEDAQIITGKVLKQQKRGDMPVSNNAPQIQYSVQNKKSYLTNLQKVFNANSYINIKFENIVVTRLENTPNIYAVTLKQQWRSGYYHDEGWLFQVIDFKDEENPLIWVTTWQPLINPNTGKEIQYNQEDIFGLGDFSFR